MPEVKLSHPEKVLFPEDGITKADLAEYYGSVAGAMLPHVHDRPLNLWRWNQGIGGRLVVQQDIPKGAPDWVQRVETPRRKGGSIEHVLCQDADTLRWLANQNCITPMSGARAATGSTARTASSSTSTPRPAAISDSCARVRCSPASACARTGWSRSR